ncbi:unnamed protein product [Acanthoscelides obtectus]|uniref:Uncharacterized protein n=1 Tax=Acanthoscelides obtectus TaxID=200917 RepID=A0A9P0KVJ2_ACAOB|nr:unnamed protein product [Acanthoscelides obtectus]CAK1637871.1 hypothetical protein AOBTE_LOCUS10250 [Acanthoscelides obtectus]
MFKKPYLIVIVCYKLICKAYRILIIITSPTTFKIDLLRKCICSLAYQFRPFLSSESDIE